VLIAAHLARDGTFRGQKTPRRPHKRGFSVLIAVR